MHQAGFPHEYDDFASTIVDGDGDDERDLEQIMRFISQHTTPGATWTVTGIEKEDVWWRLDKDLVRDLIVNSIQLNYIYDLRLYLTSGDAAWEGISTKSPRDTWSHGE